MADATIVKAVQIKTGIVKRLLKERLYYEKEAVQNANKLDTLKSQTDTDEYVLKKAREVLQESRQMVPDCARRLNVAVNELQQLLDENADQLRGNNAETSAREQIEAVNNTPMAVFD